MPRLLTFALIAGVLATPLVAQPATEWRREATEVDRGRIREIRKSWIGALESARAAGHGAAIISEGVLLDPDGAHGLTPPPPGDYACRTIKLGTQTDEIAYVAYPIFHCRIGRDGERLTFVKLDGSQRPTGRLYADNDRRMVFLGTMQLGDEQRAYQYGIDPDRDMIGALELIGPNRWRLVLPAPAHESLLDVIELTPR
jgi:hypothetical protein